MNGLAGMLFRLPEPTSLLLRARMRKGVKQLVLSVCLSVCQFVSQSGEKFLNLNIDRIKRFHPTVALTYCKRK